MFKRLALQSVCFRLVGLLVLTSAIKAPAFYGNDVTTVVNAYTNAFYVVSGTNGYFRNTQTSSGATYFWQQANEIESVIDAYEWTGDIRYQSMITNLLNGFLKNNGADWSYNGYNDDDLWAVLAFARGGQVTGKPAYCAIARANFDMVYARGWDTNLGGGLYWLYPKNHSKNACVNGPGAIAAGLLCQIYGDTNYWRKATEIYAWERAVLYNPATGRVYDNINTNGSVDQTPITYNQGTFIGAADLLGQTNDALLAATYTMNSMGGSGFMPQYGIGQNNSIFNSIFIRWLAKFMRHYNVTAPYQGWLQNNANAAWNGRRIADNLSWCQWPQATPEDTNFYSYDCISSFEALLAVPPTQVTNPTLVRLLAADSSGKSSFENGLNWADGAAPSSAHDYVVSGLTLRSPADGTSHFFAGSSLTLSNAATLACKNTGGGAGISVGTDLFLDDGEVADWAGNTATFYARITLRAGGGKFDPQGNTFNLPALIGGPGFLRVKATTLAQANGTLVVSGKNSYTGGTVLDAAHTVRLSGQGTLGDATGSLTFSNSAGFGYGTVDLNGLSLAVGRLDGGGGKISSGNTNFCVLTLGNGDASGGLFQGSLTDGAGPLALVKMGGGTQTLARNAHRLGGGLTVSGGTLIVSNALLAASNTLAVAVVGNVSGGTNVAGLDVSAATNFTFRGTLIQVGVAANTSGGTPVVIGTFSLGTNNSLTADSGVVFGDMGNAFNTNVQWVTTAPAGYTTVLTPSLTLGGSKASATWQSGAGASLNLGDSANRAALNIAVSPRGGSGSYTGNFDASAGSVNAWLSRLTLGQLANAGNGNETGWFTLGGTTNHLDITGAGTVVTVGQFVSGSGSGQAVGVLTLNNLDASSRIVSTDNSPAILLGATAKSSGTLNLGPGRLTMVTTGAGITGGAGSSMVTLDGVTLVAGAASASFITNVTAVQVLAGGVTIDTAGFDVAMPQVLGNGGGGLTKLGAGKLTLSRVNAYAGGTTVGAGTLALVEPGAIGNSAALVISNAAVLDVSGRADLTLTLNSGKALRGGGTVLGKLNALAGSTVNPGDGLGTLVVQGSANLAGTVVLELNRTNAPDCDQLIARDGVVVTGGTLIVNNLGPALAAGDRFQLFAGPVSGFAAVNLPGLSGGCVWQNQLAVDGSLRVVSTNTVALASSRSSGGQLTLSWPADHLGWRLQAQTNAALDGLGTNWWEVAGSGATNEITWPFNATAGSVFFRLVYP